MGLTKPKPLSKAVVGADGALGVGDEGAVGGGANGANGGAVESIGSLTVTGSARPKLSAKKKTKRPPKALSAIPGLGVRAGKPIYQGQTQFQANSLTPAKKGLVQKGMVHVLPKQWTVGILQNENKI